MDTKFSLLETGLSHRLELVPYHDSHTAGDMTFPLMTLPLGLPPTETTLKEEIEGLLTDMGSLPIMDVSASQRLIPREPNFHRLIHIEPEPLGTHISVDRHHSTGRLIGFSEHLLPSTTDTSRTSLSLRRAPDPTASRDLRGSNINLPFWPGGLDPSDGLDLDPVASSSGAGTAALTELDDPTQWRTTPPGFTSGLTFSSDKSAPGSEVSPSEGAAAVSEVINLADIMAGVDDIDLEDSDDEETINTKRSADGVRVNEVEQIASLAPELTRSASLDRLTEKHEEASIDSRDSKEAVKKPAADTTAHPSKKEHQYAVKVDTSVPVHDFHKRIPRMAYRWPFELDTFQKAAILRLESRDSVFVAAHTSAGKTVVAEYAIALALQHMTRTIYTSPIKALSNQKYRDFKQTFGDVGLVTGDVQLNQTAACLIMTTEILRSMLYNGSEVIRDLEWVIFDEVHYINDAERGVVWEEVLIMLPAHVGVILLSATVPNTMEFADWVGRTKRRKIYVVSTAKRPVPLEHFLYTGNSTKTCGELFMLVDSKGSFLTTGYNKALEAKKERANKSSQSFGAKGTRSGNPSQDKNTWLSVIEMLKRKDKLPAVAFTFSKKKIEENAAALQSVDLTSTGEKSEIHIFFKRCMARLRGSDQQLPQVLQCEDLLRRGLGIHHSGVLPIIKEVVEMLFQKGLVKILFATETFAMGVNMPARTVIFDSIRKHDGTNFRNLLPGEYIQMAGRAGRRGLDSTGTVILLCKGDVPETSELHKMLLGKPTALSSQFRLTYTMILNLLRVEQLRVQDMMKRSFSEFHTQKDTAVHRRALDDLRKKMAAIEDIECYLCSLDLEKYYEACREFHQLQAHLQSVMMSSPACVRLCSPGRVLMLTRPLGRCVLCVVLNSSLASGGERRFTVLALAEKGGHQEEENWDSVTNGGTLLTQSPAGHRVAPVLPCELVLPEGCTWQQMVEVTSRDIARVTTHVVRVDAAGILADERRRDHPRFKDELPDRCVTMATQELMRLSETNPTGLPGLHPVNDLKFRDMDLVEECRALQILEDSFAGFNCTQCPAFLEHYMMHDRNMGIKDEFKRLQHLLSDASLALLPEYQQRVQVLRRLHYVDARHTVQLKGRVACEISNHELMITELVFDNVLTELHPCDIAAVLSCFVFELRRCSAPRLSDTLKQAQEQIIAKAHMIASLQKEVGMKTPEEEFTEQFHFGLMEVVFEWARGMPFSEITTLTDVQEGIIVRSIQRLHETMSDVRNAARLIGDRTLSTKMEEAMDMIKRDIVFAASLYTQ